ncbi:hypothetical protein BS78_03G250500 [Paspalum vaginatum]|nr:hypothetical protein BS78_03G250500 [Paspalum vaginatum]
MLELIIRASDSPTTVHLPILICYKRIVLCLTVTAYSSVSEHSTLKITSSDPVSGDKLSIMQPAAQQRRMIASSKAIKVGPWGGRGGSPWDDGPHRGVRSITVTYGRFLESMRVEYAGRDGRPVLGEKHGGGTGRSSSREVKVDFPYEFVTGVSGSYGAAHRGSPPVVRSLTLETSRGAVHGPFGAADDADGEGVPFSYPMEGGVVVGFAGRSGWHVDALGLHIAALRAETLCDVVQERGLVAYRSLVYGDGPGVAARRHGTRPFEWCYK